MLPKIWVAENRIISKVDPNPKCIVLLVAAYSSSTDVFLTQRLFITVMGGATEVDYTSEPKNIANEVAYDWETTQSLMTNATSTTMPTWPPCAPSLVEPRAFAECPYWKYFCWVLRGSLSPSPRASYDGHVLGVLHRGSRQSESNVL